MSTSFPTVEDLIVVQGDHQTDPAWQIMEGEEGAETLADTDGWLARATIRDAIEGATELLCSTGNGRMQVGFDPPKRVNATAYTVGEQVVPTELNGYIYECTDAGTSHASTEPTWPTTIGQTVTDNGVEWTCVTTDADVTNLRLVLLPADTDALSDWGYGVWGLKVWIDGTIEKTIHTGNAVLQRDIARD